MRRKILFIVILLFILLTGLYLVFEFAFKETVVVHDQPLGDRVRVEKVALSRPGLIVVEVFLPAQGFFTIASSRIAPADTFEQVLLDVYQENIPEDISGQRGYVRIYDDVNGNGIYDQEDKVRKDLFGREVRGTFSFQ